MEDDARSVVSSSARYSSEGDTQRSGGSLKRLSQGVFSILSTDGLITSKDHISAAVKLQELIETLRTRESVSQNIQIQLICVATSLLRRIVRLRCKPEPEVRDAHDEVDFCRTLTLVFIAITAADLVARDGVPADPSFARMLDETNEQAIWQQLCKHSKRRAIADEIDELEKKRLLLEELSDRPFFVDDNNGSWQQTLAQPGNSAAAALASAGNLLMNAQMSDFAKFQTLAFDFARNTIAQMHFQLLRHQCGNSDRSFVTLSTHRFVQAMNTVAGNSRDDDVETIISAGESEIGQSVLRDLVTSFLVPRSILGTRKSLMLSRQVGERVAIEFPWVAAMAHETAMAGCKNTFENSKSELKRACALLSGLAILTTPGRGEDQGRKSVAFNGFLQLPFLETAPSTSTPGQTFLALVPASRSWSLYKVNAGKPEVLHSQKGLEGLICTALGLRNAILKPS